MIVEYLNMKFFPPLSFSSLFGPNIFINTLCQASSIYVHPSGRQTNVHTHTRRQLKTSLYSKFAIPNCTFRSCNDCTGHVTLRGRYLSPFTGEIS